MNYRFSDKLDIVKLQEFYDGDPRLAAGVFEAFVDETITALPRFDQLYLSGDLAEFKRLIHKIKPGFLYVGLTVLYERLCELEVECEKVTHASALADRFNDVSGMLLTEVPWVVQELKNLRMVEEMS